MLIPWMKKDKVSWAEGMETEGAWATGRRRTSPGTGRERQGLGTGSSSWCQDLGSPHLHTPQSLGLASAGTVQWPGSPSCLRCCTQDERAAECFQDMTTLCSLAPLLKYWRRIRHPGSSKRGRSHVTCCFVQQNPPNPQAGYWQHIRMHTYRVC